MLTYSLVAASESSILRDKTLTNYNSDTLNIDEHNIDYVSKIRTKEIDKLNLTSDDLFSGLG